MLKATNEAIVESYERHGSIYRVAEEFGMAPQTVHDRLVKLGKNKPINRFSEADKHRLIAEYERHANAGTIEKLAQDMGRTRHFLCRKAKELGLTRYGRERPYESASKSERVKRWFQENEHPRGMLGKKHTDEVRAIVGQMSRQSWARMTEDQKSEKTLKMMKTKAAKGNLVMPRIASWKAAWREIGGRRNYYRSMWEANYARYLEWLREKGEIANWEHEPETFWFDGIKRGCRSYLPDFRVTENSGRVVYHEVKGWMDDRSKTKIKRMRIYHPKIELIVIDSKAYKSIQSQVSALIPGWEARGASAT